MVNGISRKKLFQTCCVASLILIAGVRDVPAQNKFQKVIAQDALGFFGILQQADSSYFQGTITDQGVHLNGFDKFGNCQWAKFSANSYLSYLSMLPVPNNRKILLGSQGGRGLFTCVNDEGAAVWSVRLNNNNPAQVLNHLSVGKTDQSDNLVALGLDENTGISFVIKLDAQVNYLWSRQTIKRLTNLKIADDGVIRLTGKQGPDSYIWELDETGLALSCHSFHSDSVPLIIRDFIIEDDHSKVILFQTGDYPRTQIGLARLNDQWQVVWSKLYTDINGFREVGGLKETQSADYLVTANIINPDFGTELLPPYHSFLAAFDEEGNVRKAQRYHGGYKIAGLTDEKFTPDGGIILSAYVSDTSQQIFQPFLVKMDSIWNSGCYQDTVHLSQHPLNLVISEISDYLTHRSDTLLSTSIFFAEEAVPGITTLCYNGIEEEQQQDGFLCYPNPATDQMTVLKKNDLDNILEIRCLDYSGKLLLTVAPEPSEREVVVNIQHLSPSCYIVMVVTQFRVYYSKFIKL